MNRLPASQRHKAHVKRWKRYEKQQPGHRVQIDVKVIEPVKGARAKRYYQYAAIALARRSGPREFAARLISL